MPLQTNKKNYIKLVRWKRVHKCMRLKAHKHHYTNARVCMKNNCF